MPLEQFSIRLLFLLFPGLLAVTLVRLFTPFRQDHWGRFSIYVVVLSVLSYLLLTGLESAIAPRFPAIADGRVEFFRYLSGETTVVSTKEVAVASSIGLIVGVGSSWVANQGWLHRAARSVGVTTRTGSADIWDFSLGARGEAPWVTVRDYENELAYFGWVKASSDRSDEPELLLYDVTVSTNEGTVLYENLPALYLRRSPDDLTVELEAGIIDGQHIESLVEQGDDEDDRLEEDQEE